MCGLREGDLGQNSEELQLQRDKENASKTGKDHAGSGDNQQGERSVSEALGLGRHTEEVVSVSKAPERLSKVRAEKCPLDLTKIIGELYKSFREVMDGQAPAATGQREYER